MLGAQRGAAAPGRRRRRAWPSPPRSRPGSCAQAILGQFSRYGDQLQAVTGLIAIAVLLVIMNWFFHKVYWTKWIGKRNAQRKRALARRHDRRPDRRPAAARLHERLPRRLRGRPLPADPPAGGGHRDGARGRRDRPRRDVRRRRRMFFLQQKLPYKRMLVVTGVMLGVVLVVMVGGSARTLQDVGWLSDARRSASRSRTGGRAGSRSCRPGRPSARRSSRRPS